MEFPYGILLIVLSVVSLIIGIGIAVIGGMLRFNQADHLNSFLENKATGWVEGATDKMLIAPDKFDKVDLGNSVSLLSLLAIIAGVLVILYALVGVVSGILKNVSLLFLFIGTVLVSTMLQFMLIWMMIDSSSSFHQQGRDDLANKLGSKYKLGPQANEFSKMMNSIMITGECCGINNPTDFMNLTYKEVPLKVSPACCFKNYGDYMSSDITKSKKEEFQSMLITCAKQDKGGHFNKGCYDTLYDAAYKASVGSYVIIIGILIAWQVLAVAVAVLLLFQPKDEEKMEAGPTIQEEVQVEEKKPFTPFSKLSSFQTSEVNRMRSTEIW